jgi:hypothetical protein
MLESRTPYGRAAPRSWSRPFLMSITAIAARNRLVTLFRAFPHEHHECSGERENGAGDEDVGDDRYQGGGEAVGIHHEEGRAEGNDGDENGDESEEDVPEHGLVHLSPALSSL